MRQWRRTVAAVVLALLFVADMPRGNKPHRALLVVPVLLVCLGWREFRWRGLFGTLLLFVVVGSAAWSASPYLHDRLARSITEYEAYRTKNEPNSTGLHLEFLRKSLSFVETAPIIGHGTGSIPDQFRQSETGHDSTPRSIRKIRTIRFSRYDPARPDRNRCADRHVDRASLIVYRRRRLVAWIGMIVVVQNIVSSLFNSHLFDFTSGWLYVFGVGVVGGMVLRQKDLGKDIPLALPMVGIKNPAS